MTEQETFEDYMCKCIDEMPDDLDSIVTQNVFAARRWDKKRIEKINELTEQNKILQKQLAEKELELIGKEPLYSRRKLQKQNKILMEAIEFYGNEKNWYSGSVAGNRWKPMILKDCCEKGIGGYRAREAKRKIEATKKKGE